MASVSTSRFLVYFFAFLLCLHLPISLYRHLDSSTSTSATSWLSLPLSSSIITSNDDSSCTESTEYSYRLPRANATFVILARNEDLHGVISSIKQMEDRFNRHHNYSWVLLNEEPFTDEFKRRTSILTKSEISYGLIPREHWVQPSFIDENRAARARATMVAKNIFHGESVSYRNMCRFNAGFFYKHPLLAQYKYYWRVEPYVTYFCDLPYDPFLYMEENDKVYSFVIALEELGDTVPTLWDTVKKFTREYPQYIAPDNSIDFVSDDHGESFNLCHFWSNFELGSLDFWRSPAYTAFFNTLDLSGGFYYERWGDAPVHSIAASLLLNRTQIHFWSDIGYKHDEFQHCPQGSEHKIGKCSCDPSDNFDHQGFASCLSTWEEVRYPNLTLPDAEDDGEMELETPPLVVEERESSD